MSFESVLISFKALCSRRWGTEVTEQEVEKYTALLASLRPFLEVNTGTALNNDKIYAVFQSFDYAFDPKKCYHWSIVSLCIDFLEVIVTRKETLTDLPIEKIETYTSILLEHNEPRIRTSVTNLIKVLCAKASPEDDSLYTRLIPMFLTGVHQNWQRSSTTRDAVLGTEKQILLDDTTGWNHLESYVRALHAVFVGISRHSVPNAMKHLQNHPLILPTKDYHSMFPSYNHTDSLLSDLLSIADTDRTTTDTIRVDCAELLFTHASLHLNRHIRELTFRFIADLLALTLTTSVNVGAYDMPSRGVQMTDVFPRMPGAALPYAPLPLPLPLPQMPTTPPPGPALPTTTTAREPMWHTNTDYHIIAHRIASALVTGLQDDWSQIRHAASMGCQSFLVSLTTDTTNNNANRDVSNTAHSPLLSLYWPALLPRLCMNRFYPAVSVQTVSQATWRDILGPNTLGRQLISQHAQSVVTYYISMTSARNHMTAEAACQAIAEFIQRMEYGVVNSHIPMLLDALLDCLRDDRWPVRDAAIVASSMITRYYATNPVTITALPTLLHLWQENLTDFIWSIREHAAMAFAEAVQCTNSVNIDNTTMTSNGDTVKKSSCAVSEQRSLVIQTALHYIRTHLLYALQSPIERGDISIKSVTISDPTTTSAVSVAGGSKPTKGPAAFSFLPQSLLDADAAAKAKKLQKEINFTTTFNTTDSTDTISSNPILVSTVDIIADSSTTNDTHHSKNKDRKGWGCCIDCVELRTCLPWEVTHGAVYLLREMAIVDPSVLFEVYTKNNGDISAGINTTIHDRVEDSQNDDGAVEGTVALGSQNTLLSKVFSLLSESILSATTAAGDATLSKETVVTGTSEAELLVVALYEEVPIFLSTALQWVKQCLPDEERVRFSYSQLPMEALFSCLTRDLKAAVSQDGTTASVSAPKYTTTTYGADGSVSTSMTSGYKASTSNSSSSNSANPSVQVGGTSVSNSSAVNRRNQQVARRSARNRDKVVIAAERCLTRVLDLLCSAEVGVVMEIVHHPNVNTNNAVGSRVLSEAQLHDSLLDNFSGDMRVYVKNMMKW